jgi:AcrR family transcriptional regulator
VDEGGLTALTMAAAARELAVTPMALYRHVQGKDDLLDGIVELLLVEIATEVALNEDDGLEAALRRFIDAAEHAAAAHPEAFLLLLTRPARTTAAEAIRDQVYRVLRASEVPDHLMLAAERHVTTAVLGMAAGHALGRFPSTSDSNLTARFVLTGLAGLRTDREDQ